MPRKKKSQFDQVPADLSAVEWINTPFSLVKFGKGFSLIQQQALIKVSNELQRYISDFYREHRNLSGERPLPLFTREVLENKITFRLYASDFGVQSSNYEKVFEAFTTISNTKVKAPNMIDGKKGTIWYNVFSDFQVPDNEKGYTYIDANGEKQTSERRDGYADFTINPYVAQYAFDMSSGYVNHPAELAMNAQQRYAPLLYFLIKHSAGSRKKVSVEYREVQQMLGTIYTETIEDEQGNQLEEEKNDFPLFSKFKQRVLDVAQADIDRMAALNQVDITFTYEPYYKRRCKRGNPDEIIFSITPTELGRYHSTHKGGASRSERTVPAPEPSLFDSAQTDILEALQREFGNGQMGFEYYFGRRCQVRVGEELVSIKVPKSMVHTILSSESVLARISACCNGARFEIVS